MKNIIETMPGYRLNEYQLVIMPSEDIRHRVMQVRKDFAERLGMTKPWSGPAHIPLIRFSQVEMMEEKMIRTIKAIAMGIQPFRMELKDFGTYPTHSIFINNTSRTATGELVKQLKQASRILRSSEGEPQFSQDFHIPIAKKLLPWQFEKGWQDQSHRSFTGKFMVNSLLLLKRAGAYNQYAVAAHFPCLDLPVLSKQATLF